MLALGVPVVPDIRANARRRLLFDPVLSVFGSDTPRFPVFDFDELGDTRILKNRLLKMLGFVHGEPVPGPEQIGRLTGAVCHRAGSIVQAGREDSRLL